MIRKISIGADYKLAMHYIVGQTVLKDYIIDSIIFNEKKQVYQLYVKRDGEIRAWKQFNSAMPCSIEFDLNY